MPQADWPDDLVIAAATRAAERVVDVGVGRRSGQAGQAEQIAEGLDRQITSRDRDQQQAIAANETRDGQRQALVTAAEADRATIAQARQARAGRSETMTPEAIAAADVARDAMVDEQARHQQQLAQQQQLARQHDQARRLADHHRLPPGIDRGGPGIEM